jgi:hypothetical protein
MAATSKFQLLVESQTRGEAEIARLSATVNKLSADLEKANRKMASDAAAAQQRFSEAMGKMRQDSERTGRGVKQSSDEGGAALSSYARAALVAYAGVKTLSGGFQSLIRETGEAALEIKSLSLSTGLSVNQADKLRAAANLTGFDIRNLKEASLDLSVALKDTGGQGDQTRKLLQQLGVTAFTSAGQTRPLNEVLLDTFDALSKIQDTTTRVNLSRVLGGEDAAKSVQPLLAGYQEANRLAEQLGFGTREGVLRALEESNRQLKAFDLQWEIIKGKLAEKIAPVVVPILLAVSNESTGNQASALLRGQISAPQFLLDAVGGARLNEDGLRGALAPKVPGGLTDFSSGTQLAARFRGGQSGTVESFRARLETIGKERQDLIAKLSSGSLGQDAFAKANQQLARLTAEQFSIDASITQIERARQGAQITVNSTDLINANIGAGIITPRPPTLRRRGPDGFLLPEGAGSTFITNQADIAGANPDSGLFSTRAALENRKMQDERQRNLAFVQQELQFQERRIELLTGPGGEAAAINKIAELRRAALEQEQQLGAEIFNLRERQLQIEEDRALQLLAIQRQRRDENRALTSDFVGSIQAGRGGDFFRQQGSRLVNQIGTNALSPFVDRLSGTLGTIGGASGLGGLLRGTLFDPANATPVDKNTAATERNTAAIERSTGGGLVPGVAGGGKLSSLLGVFGSDTNGLTGTGSLRLPAGIGRFSAGTGSVATAGLFAGLSGEERSVALTPGFATTASSLGLTTRSGRIGNNIGSAVALASAGFGAVDGFRRGGVGGNLQGVASVLGGLSLIPGPQQPFFVAGSVLAAGFAAALPNPKLRRGRQLDQLLDSSLYAGADPMAFDFDQVGRSYDTNKRGDIRAMPNLTVNINALDAGSVMDSREMIADAVRAAMIDGHGINRTAQEVVLAR